MLNDDIQKERTRAQIAMSKTNNGRVDSLDKNNENNQKIINDLEQKKIEARKAMESREHKEIREKREAEIEAITLHKEKIIEIRQRRELIEKQKALESATEKEKLSQQNINEQNQYKQDLQKASSTIENIKNSDPYISPLRTLKTDQEPILMEAKNISATIRQENQQNQKYIPNQSSWLKILVIIFIFILFLSSIFIIYAVNKKTTSIQTEVPIENIFSLIPVNTNAKINVDSKTPVNIISEIKSNLRPSVTGPSLQQIYLESTQTDTEGNQNIKRLETIDFLSVTNTSLPTDFIHFLQPAYMLANFADINKPASISILLTTRSFEHTYAKLLDSESNILSSLYKNFLTPDQLDLIKNKDFIDKTINNIDTRGIYTDDGELIIMYSFINPKLLIITTNTESFKAIIDSYRQLSNSS